MNSEIKISIIVPIYNVEKYIERCTRSLMEQTLLEGIEYIFVNDATLDNSVAILKTVVSDYPKRKDQVRIINNPQNLGITETRKRGINFSRGEYIGWCDPDDWCETNMYETMLNSTQQGKIDIVVCNTWYHIVSHGKENIMENKFFSAPSPQKALFNIYKGGGISFTPALINIISKRELIKKSAENIYPTNRSEDRFIMMNCFYMAQSAVWMEKPFYHINTSNESSLTHRKLTKEGWKAQMRNIENFVKLINTNPQQNNARDLRILSNYVKWSRKEFFASTFDSCWNFWNTYKECYRDICEITNTPSKIRWKVYIFYNLYPLFWLKNHKSFKR